MTVSEFTLSGGNKNIFQKKSTRCASTNGKMVQCVGMFHQHTILEKWFNVWECSTSILY
jgi:hypothetical protein